MSHAKLDYYEHSLTKHFEDFYGEVWHITIPINGRSDIDVADIASEINACNSRIFLNGKYYRKLRMETTNNNITIIVMRSGE